MNKWILLISVPTFAWIFWQPNLPKAVVSDSTKSSQVAKSTLSAVKTQQVPNPRNAPLEMAESVSEKRLQQLTNLSRIVIPTPARTAALRPLLQDPALVAEIHAALNDPEALSGPLFTRKLRLMDAMYEGLKFSDESIRSSYIDLTRTILNESLADHRLLADRAEIALVLMKAIPETARQLRQEATVQGKEAFRQAARIASLYQVAL